MRIIAGSAKGRRLVGPRSDRIRPALDKVKQAIFNILGTIDGTRALDLFAGTGSIGIEALSRGAAQAAFVDADPEALKIVHKNLSLCRFEERADVLRMKIPAGLASWRKKGGPFDLIFVDPPYDRDLVNPTLAAIPRADLLSPSGWVVVEHSPREKIHRDCGLEVMSQRSYGQTIVSFLIKVR